MKKITTLAFLTTAISAHGADKIGLAHNQNQILDSVLNQSRIYSTGSHLEVTVLEMIGAGMTVNPLQVAISIDMGDAQAPKLFAIDSINMNSITSINSLGGDRILVRFKQAQIDSESMAIDQIIDKEIKITVLRDANGQIGDSILVEEDGD